MKNLSNLLALLVLVAMMGLLAGCGCGTTGTPAEDDMVNNTQEALPPEETMEVLPEETLPAEPSISDNTLLEEEMDGTVVDENGNVIDDAVGTEGNPVDDASDVVGDLVDDAGNVVSDVGEDIKDMTKPDQEPARNAQ